MSNEQLVRQYTLQTSETEHARVIKVAQRDADRVHEMCVRSGVAEGARVVDVGCGPIGASLSLQRLSALRAPWWAWRAVEAARAIVTRRGLGNVRVVHGDINALAPMEITKDGPFDAAYSRFVLVHQNDLSFPFVQVIAQVP
jgi:hypothetical protein